MRLSFNLKTTSNGDERTTDPETSPVGTMALEPVP